MPNTHKPVKTLVGVKMISLNGVGFKSCPFCGESPSIETIGTWIEIDCCASMSIQKSDYLDRDKITWDNKKHVYDDAAEKKALEVIAGFWNTRVGET